jgi:hypothetical protein
MFYLQSQDYVILKMTDNVVSYENKKIYGIWNLKIYLNYLRSTRLNIAVHNRNTVDL